VALQVAQALRREQTGLVTILTEEVAEFILGDLDVLQGMMHQQACPEIQEWFSFNFP
jgi:hypothetical protein